MHDWLSKSSELSDILPYNVICFLDDDWVFWNTQFHLLNSLIPFDYVILYFKGPPAHMDILIDDVTLVPITQLVDWREYSNDRIDDIRKRDIVLR